MGCFFGKAVGQTFIATDTLIRSISVWQHRADFYEHMALWVARADSTGAPDLIRGLVYMGARYFNQLDSHIRYAFDPPLVLPSPGLYGFFFQDVCGTLFALYYNRTDDLFPTGRIWGTGRTIGFGCYIDPAPFYYFDDAQTDLIFEVEFCNTTTTPVRRTSWGQLKMRYR